MNATVRWFRKEQKYLKRICSNSGLSWNVQLLGSQLKLFFLSKHTACVLRYRYSYPPSKTSLSSEEAAAVIGPITDIRLSNSYSHIFSNHIIDLGLRGNAVDWSTALQGGRSRVRFPKWSLGLLTDLILQASRIHSASNRNEYQGYILGVKMAGTWK
jgi:hypothetical protein